MLQINPVLREALADPQNGWSIGTFGAVGEFMRTPEEEADICFLDDIAEVVTARGGIRVQPHSDLNILAFETLASDGETWGNSVAFCLPLPAQIGEQSIRCLGADSEALRPQDSGAILFDTGVARGLVSMCVRTDNAELIAALDALEGGRLLSHEGATAAALILKQSPHRVMLSPLGRVEVFSSIPTADGQSPSGPHTHLLPKLITSGRTHGANVPIPEGLQPALMLHPSSPWRDLLGKRTPFDAVLAKNFDRLLEAYGLPEDKHVRTDVEAAIRGGVAPADYSWPRSRRARAQARITLRKLAQSRNSEILRSWKMFYDRGAEEDGDTAFAAHG